MSNFSPEGAQLHLLIDSQHFEGAEALRERGQMLRCMGCGQALVVVVDQAGRGLHWYPTPGAALLDDDVPEPVASSYDEGVRCLSIGASRAAAVMFRGALHCFIKDKGSERAKGERHLKTALKYMKADGLLHSALADWADELNQLGNEGAHPEDYDEVTPGEAKALGDFVRQLIRLEYEMGAQLNRVRNRDKAELAAEAGNRPSTDLPPPAPEGDA